MARIPIIMPKMSMTMTEGEVATWLVKVGDQVNEGDVIAEVMTDKVDMEVESTHTGTLVEITVEDGMVAVGEPIGYLEGEESGLGDLFGSDDDSADEEPAPEEPAGDVPDDPPVPTRESEPVATSGPIAAVPRARGLAREHGLDLDAGPGERPRGSGHRRGRRDGHRSVGAPGRSGRRAQADNHHPQAHPGSFGRDPGRGGPQDDRERVGAPVHGLA